MSYLHYFELYNPVYLLRIGYVCVCPTDTMSTGYHAVTSMTFDEAKETAKKNGYTFIDSRIKDQKAATEEKVQKAAPGKRMPSAKCLDDARRIQGKGKYRTMMNFCYGDGYFARSCIDKYGEAMWKEANEIVRKEK